MGQCPPRRAKKAPLAPSLAAPLVLAVDVKVSVPPAFSVTARQSQGLGHQR